MSDRGKSSLLRDDDIIFFDFFYKQIAHSFLHTLRVQPIVRLSYGLQTPPSGASSGMTCRMLVPVLFCRPALFQPQGKVRARPGPSGEALCMAAPCKRHGVNDATRSLRV